jgi:hypothetical protein
MTKTIELPEERSCSNCAFANGCKFLYDDEICDEHKFDDEVDDETTEKEKMLMYADSLYQRLKEDDL